MTGESLGAFTATLLATVEPGLDAVVPVLPFGSIPQLLWAHGEDTPARIRARQAGVDFDRFAAAFAATTPLQRSLAIPSRRVLLVAAEYDRVTPIHFARELRDHCSIAAPEPVELHVFPGGHLLHVGVEASHRKIGSFLLER